jgi:hypothetical protein
MVGKWGNRMGMARLGGEGWPKGKGDTLFLANEWGVPRAAKNTVKKAACVPDHSSRT